MNDRFVQIYETNEWGHGSGEGSLPVHTSGYVAFLRRFLSRNGVRSVVDMGCGDWQFSKDINWGGASYRGYDVVPSVIERNIRAFGSREASFSLYSGNPRDLPPADLLIVKDVLQHLSNDEVVSWMGCLDRYRFALVTNCVDPRRATANVDIERGDFRYIDLRLPPFSLPAREVYAFTNSMSPIRRFLRGPDWRKSVLLYTRGNP